jgi:hypothetical protein
MTTYLIRFGRVTDEDGLNSTSHPSRHSCLISLSERQSYIKTRVASVRFLVPARLAENRKRHDRGKPFSKRGK